MISPVIEKTGYWVHVGYIDPAEPAVVKWKIAEPMIGMVQLDDPPKDFTWAPSTPTRPVAHDVVVEYQSPKGGAWYWTFIGSSWEFYGEDSESAFNLVGISMVP